MIQFFWMCKKKEKNIRYINKGILNNSISYMVTTEVQADYQRINSDGTNI